MNTIGIDVSKKELVYSIYNKELDTFVGRGTVANKAEAIGQFLTQMEKQAPLIVEPTGRYSLPLAREATRQGFDVRLAPTLLAKGYLQSINARCKDDRVDSEGLARYGAQARLRAYPIKSDRVEQIEQLLTVRKTLSHSLAKLRQLRKELEFVVETIDHSIAQIRCDIKRVDDQILALAKSNTEFKPAMELMKVPGIGPVTAITATACLISKPFENADKFVAYVGLDCRVRKSGDRESVRYLSKNGDPELRRLFYICVQSILRNKENPFSISYQNHRERGLTTTEATVAVARKLARLCWAIVHYRREYDPARVLMPPKPREEIVSLPPAEQ